MGFAFWSPGASAEGHPEITPPVLPVVPARGECFALSPGYWRLASTVEFTDSLSVELLRPLPEGWRALLEPGRESHSIRGSRAAGGGVAHR